ncbi:MAG: hypothetical protein ACI9LY_003210 [Arenicella sp.]|jgi:hypothetical protein
MSRFGQRIAKLKSFCINHDRFKDQDEPSVFTDLCSFTAYSVIQRKALAAPQFRIFCDAAFAPSFIRRVSNSVLPKLIAGVGHQKNHSFHRCTVDSFKRLQHIQHALGHIGQGDII